MDLEERIMELSRYGYACGQILAILLLGCLVMILCDFHKRKHV